MSILSTLKTAVTSGAGRQILQLQKSSPHIMFVAGAIGIVGTVVVASRATLKLDKALDENLEKMEKAKAVFASGDENYDEKAFRRDMVILYTRNVMVVSKLYAPAVALGLVSIGLLTGSHVVLTRRNVALTAAYAAVDKAFREYRERIVDRFGEDVDRESRYGYVERAENSTDADGKEITLRHRVVKSGEPSQYARFFDQMCSSWNREPEYNMLFLRSQQNWANDLLRSRGHVFLNEVYDMIGVPRSKAGAVVGWVLNKNGEGDNYIDFGIFDGNNPMARMFVNGNEGSLLCDFNVDGIIYDKI
jgi:hypothetical protein